ncbi:MAG: threonine--tRNA ligase [Legionellales bacterium]|nr:threonine--tRNA ligase [Legionellales bacterium]
MLTITLPDQSQRQFASPLTVFELAQSIGTGLAKAALAAKIDDKLVDTSFLITTDSNVAIITDKDPDGLEIIRHSTAHLLAHAVKTLYPSAQVTIGPVIEDGFYYDFAFERPFTPEDLEKIELKMHELAKQDFSVSRITMKRDEARLFFLNQGENYKAEIIDAIPETETLSLYQQGDFVDLCRGPHVPNTGKLKIFKLMKVAGAYWRGNADNEMLQRIYGTAWPDKKMLDAYLYRLEEAQKRDHRKLGQELDLFHFQDIAPGMVFWHDKGWLIYQTIEQYLRKKLRKYGYEEVRTPQILSRRLWELTGHWDNYRDEMFTTQSENQDFAIKPMNCPCHIQIFKHGLKSYRDLPIRMAEFGSCHRNELSGALHGLMRVRGFTQDDAHIFCTEDQIQDEVLKLIDLTNEVYTDFGFNEVQFHLSTRPAKRVGSDEIWDKAENALKEALDAKGLKWVLNQGDGAFYGPKIDFRLCDSIGRIWQCGTIQLDFAVPARLDATYIAEDSSRQTPVMIHRALVGSMERFIGVLIEHYAGRFPFWLAPVQVVIMNITDRQRDYVTEMTKKLQELGFRVKFDLRNEKIGFKIREHTLQRVPYLLVVGDKELENTEVSVRTREGEVLGSMSIASLVSLLHQHVLSI